MESYKREFIQFLEGAGVLKFGDFTAKSGRKIPYFINAGMIKTGAAIATLASYALVLLLRMIDVPRLLPFDLCLPRFLISFALVLASCYFMTARPGGWWLAGLLACTGITVAISVLPLVRNLKRMLAARRK